MDQLPSLGRPIPQVLARTSQIYGDLLAKNSAEAIRATKRETYTYGPHSRHHVDLYVPSASGRPVEDENQRPLFVFIYGGGFANGDRVLERIPGGLVYTNVGHFFAERFGFETLIPDYRLLGHGATVADGPADDIATLLEWIRKRYSSRNIVLVGNSAGGVALATWLLAERFRSSRASIMGTMASVQLRGVALLGAPADFDDAPPAQQPVLRQFFGDDYAAETPWALLQKASVSELHSWPQLRIIYSELDPEFIIRSDEEFCAALQRVGVPVTSVMLKRHNHISPPLALGTGLEEEEAWGVALGDWSLSVSGM
jgi:acetyl esterase/lipase